MMRDRDGRGPPPRGGMAQKLGSGRGAGQMERPLHRTASLRLHCWQSLGSGTLFIVFAFLLIFFLALECDTAFLIISLM